MYTCTTFIKHVYNMYTTYMYVKHVYNTYVTCIQHILGMELSYMDQLCQEFGLVL